MTLRHPNIVQFIGVKLEPDTMSLQWLVTELADTSLNKHLCARRPVSRAKLLQAMIHIVRGLQCLHSKDLVHRGLKPANVLLFGEVAKIADVGLSRVASSSSSMTHGVGTVYYMAPEVLEGRYSTKVDMFSFGVMFAEICLYHLAHPRVASILPPVPQPPPPRYVMLQKSLERLEHEWSSVVGLVQSLTSSTPSDRPTAEGVLQVLEREAGAQ